MTRKRRIYLVLVLAAAVAAVVASLVNAKTEWMRARTGDISVYVRSGERMARGEEIYRPDDVRPFTYPPFLAAPFTAYRLLPAAAARPTWYVLNILVLVTILFVLHRNLKPWLLAPERARAPHRVFFWALLLASVFRGIGANFQNQSNDLYITLLVLLCADAAARRRDAVSGAFAAVGAAIKATPLLFLPVFVWQRRWMAAAGLCVALAATTFLPDVVFPRDDDRLWVVAWSDTFLKGVKPGQTVGKVGGAWSETNILNQNLAGTIHRLTTPVEEDGNMQIDASIWHPEPGTRKAVILAAQLLVLALVCAATLPRWTKGLSGSELAYRRFGEAAAVGCGMVLLSPMSSKNHFAILLLPVAFCLTECFYRRRDVVALGHVILVLAFASLTTKGIWGRTLGNQLQARGVVTWAALFALTGTVWVLVRRGRAESPR